MLQFFKRSVVKILIGGQTVTMEDEFKANEFSINDSYMKICTKIL